MSAANHKQVLDFIEICSIIDNKISSPVLWSVTKKDKNGNFKYLLWQIIIESDKNVLQKDVVEKNIRHDKVFYYTISGMENGKMTISSKTHITVGKNIGKNNETTILTQSLLNIRTQYNKKKREGRKENKQNLITNDITFDDILKDTTRGDKPWRIIPMALKDVNNKKVKTSYWTSYIKYPTYVQPKYDGIRMLSVYVHKNNIGLDIYSRGLENIENQDEIKKSLENLKNHKGLYLDGELWGEGLSLQVISGIGRRIDKNNDNIKLKYYVYDCFMIDKPDMTFVERYNLLKTVKLGNDITIVPSQICNTKDDIMDRYTQFLEDKYEGAVIRNADSKYEFGIQKELRSSTTLKLKPNNDEEYMLVDYKSGSKGKDTNAVIWILQITNETVKRDLQYNMNAQIPTNQSVKLFDAVSKNEMGIYDNRYKIYKYLQNNPNYFKENMYGTQMTVEFSVISNAGKPQQPKVKGFRDLQLQKKIMKDIGI